MTIIEVSKYAEKGSCAFFDFNPDALTFCNFYGETRISLEFPTYINYDSFVKHIQYHERHLDWQFLTFTNNLTVRDNQKYGWKSVNKQQEYFGVLSNVFRYMILKDKNPKLMLDEFEELDPGYKFINELMKFYENVDLDLVHLYLELQKYNGYLSRSDANNIDHLVQKTVKPEVPAKKTR